MDGRIVIVDDKPITGLDIRDIMIEAGHEVVDEAVDGLETIEVCKKTQPDLVLMDIQMPVLDDLKADKKIVQDQLTSSIAFLPTYSNV